MLCYLYTDLVDFLVLVVEVGEARRGVAEDLLDGAHVVANLVRGEELVLTYDHSATQKQYAK